MCLEHTPIRNESTKTAGNALKTLLYGLHFLAQHKKSKEVYCIDLLAVLLVISITSFVNWSSNVDERGWWSMVKVLVLMRFFGQASSEFDKVGVSSRTNKCSWLEGCHVGIKRKLFWSLKIGKILALLT